MEVGNIVIVDNQYANGGYEAEVIWVGNHFARIKVKTGEEWDIMKRRLQLK
jgi:hypothetical protein